MTQEDKDLLLKDLCARLPYGVKVEYKCEKYDVLGIAHERLVLCKPFMSYTLNEHPLVEEVKPYLFPPSSITEEQRLELRKIMDIVEAKFVNACCKGGFTLSFTSLNDWLNKNHIDYRGLIGKELVIDATGKGIY